MADNKKHTDCGIIAYGAYVPHWHIERSQIKEALNAGGGEGSRRVANFDENTTTMGVEAARLALKCLSESSSASAEPSIINIANLWFSTAEPAYLEKTNAGAIHAALRLDQNVSALDLGGASRSGIGVLKNALRTGDTLAVLSGLRSGMPGSNDESSGGDGAAAFLTGEDKPIAYYLGGASATNEFLDRWRQPGENHTHQWEERFGEHAYDPLVESTLKSALGNAGLNLEDLDRVAVAGTQQRAANKAKKLIPAEKLADDLLKDVGNTGAAHPGILLSSMLDISEPNQTLAVVWLADGVEVLIVKTTKEIQNYKAGLPLSQQLQEGAQVSYMNFLRRRGFVKVQPANRPEPPRISAPAALRGGDWKYSFEGSRGDQTETLHLPPARISIKEGDAQDAMTPAPMADTQATIATYTIDRLVYSESPPVIFAIVDFDGGGRFPVELTDVDESEVEIGMRVEMVFRKLYTAEGIHNYFYKARPIRKQG